MRPAYQPVLQIALPRKIKQHYSQQNRQDALPRHARNGHQDSEPDQQQAQHILREDTKEANGGMSLRPQVSWPVLLKIIGRNPDHDETNYRQAYRESYRG